MDYLVSILIFLPAFAAILGFVVSKESIRVYGILVTFIEFLLSLFLWANFDNLDSGIQFVEITPLISSFTFKVNYFVGIDGISLFLVVLSTFMTFISLVGLSITKNLKNLIISILFLEMTMVGVFVALDAIVFYIFWELSLVPMLYIIGAWGGAKRVYASVKFFLYTFFGSLIMLLGILYIAYLHYQIKGEWSFSIIDWHYLVLDFNTQVILFLAFFMGFAIKVPMFPFHTWLPYAHGEAPTIGSVILAAVLLKMGTYGFIRVSLPVFPDASISLITPIAILSLIMIIYTAFIAFAQKDMKQVIAYSSISHMGVIILGIFAMNIEGIGGSIFLMLSHGIVSGALFLLVGVIYDRRGTKLISEFGGLASSMPIYATIFGIMLMASVGLPLTIGFVGEFLSLIGFFKVSPFMTILAGSTIVLGAVYMLYLFKKSFLCNITNDKNSNLKDLNKNELYALVPLAVLVVVLGVYPKPILEPIDRSVNELVLHMKDKSIKVENKEFLNRVNSIKYDTKVR